MGKKPPAIGSLLKSSEEKQSRQDAIDKMYDQEENNDINPSKSSLHAVETNTNNNSEVKETKKVSQMSERVPKRSNTTQASESEFSIHSVLTAPAIKEGYVKRNFNIRNDHMNGIKALTQRANNNGSRKTQDDIVNAIFKDFFEKYPVD